MPPKRRHPQKATQFIKLEQSIEVATQIGSFPQEHFSHQLLINMNGDPYQTGGAANGSTDTGVIYSNPANSNGATTNQWTVFPFNAPGTANPGTGEVWSQNNLINRKRLYMVKITYTPRYSTLEINAGVGKQADGDNLQITHFEPGYIVHSKRGLEKSANVFADATFDTLRTTATPLRYLKWQKKFKINMVCPQISFKDRVFQTAVPETRRYNCGQWSSDNTSDNMSSFTGTAGEMGPQHAYGGHIFIQMPQVIASPMLTSIILGDLRITAYYKGFLDI